MRASGWIAPAHASDTVDEELTCLDRARRSAARRALEVWKFGGASLADAAAIARAVALIQAHPGPLVVVASRRWRRDRPAARRRRPRRRRRSPRRPGRGGHVPAPPPRRSRTASCPARPRAGDGCWRHRERRRASTASSAHAIGVLGHLAPRASDLLVLARRTRRRRGRRGRAARGAAGAPPTSMRPRSWSPTAITAAPRPTSPATRAARAAALLPLAGARDHAGRARLHRRGRPTAA